MAARKRPLRVVGEKAERFDPIAQGPPRASIRVPAALARPFSLLFQTIRPGVPAILLAVTSPLGGCYLSHGPRDAGMDAPPPPPPDFGPPPICFAGEEQTFVVELPPEGVRAEPALICAEPGMSVESALAARVELMTTGDPRIASAVLTIASSIGTIEGLPSVTEVEGRFAVTLGPVRADGAVFRFDVDFGGPLLVPGMMFDTGARLYFQTRFEIACAPGDRREVVASTIVHLCYEDDGSVVFASSGDECKACAIIAEMAPTPIIPMEQPDALALQQGMRAGIRPIARFANATVLWAEHDQPNRNARYAWFASDGELRRVTDDVMVWVHEGESPAMVQVAIESDTAAAVSTYRTGGGL